MAFIETKKKVTIIYNDLKVDLLSGITDIGPVEGLKGFLGLWIDTSEVPYKIVRLEEVRSIKLVDEVPYGNY